MRDASKFKSEIGAYLKENEASLNLGERKLLLRWASDDRADDVWSKIRAKSERPNHEFNPSLLIFIVLKIRRTTSNTKASRESDQNRRKELVELAEMSNRLADFWDRDSKKFAAMGVDLPAQCARWNRRAAMMLKSFAAVSGSPLVPLIRKSQKPNPRLEFLSALSNFFHDSFGAFLDVQVAVLAEIVFNQSDDDFDFIQALKNMRRPRARARTK